VEGVCLSLVLEEFPGDCTHEWVSPECFNKLKPTSDARRICALRRLLDAIGNGLLALITELADRVEQRDRCRRCHGRHVREGTWA
jgi:hypothetical protein